MAFRKGFWEDGGWDCAKTRLRENLERIAKDEEAAVANTGGDPGPSEPAAKHEGEGNGGQDCHTLKFPPFSCFKNWLNKLLEEIILINLELNP